MKIRFPAILTAALLSLYAHAATAQVQAYGALACPACFGLEPVEDKVFFETDSGLDPAEIQALVQEATRRVEDFYGDFSARQTLVICASDACYERLGGGGSLGMTFAYWLTIISRDGTNVPVIAHEFAHVATHSRLGFLGRVPAWFDEGLAVVVSGDPAFMEVPCPDTIGDLPRHPLIWSREARDGDAWELYHNAACKVQDWMAENGGKQALLDILSGEKDAPPDFWDGTK